MISNTEFKKFAELDLNSVKIKLMHKSGEGWTQAQADAVELEYRRFLFLMMKYPQEQTSPREEVDVFWHYHILDTAKYAADCDAAFGYFLHHYPFFGMFGDGAEAALSGAGDRMRELYEENFGVVYDRDLLGGHGSSAPQAGQAVPAYCTLAAAAYCSIPTAKAQPAYCSIPTVKAQPAYCSIPTAKAQPAYCSIPTAKAQPAYCSIPTVKAQPAYCSIPTAKAQPAYCSIPTAKAQAAYCSIPTEKAKASYCSIPTNKADAAYCSVPTAELICQPDAARESLAPH